MSLLRRLLAFLLGDQVKAEALDTKEIQVEPWVEQSRSQGDLADYVLEATKRSADASNGAVESLQEKAATLSSLLVAVVPLAVAGTAWVAGRASGSWSWVVVVLLCIAVGLLVVALVFAFIVSGEVLVGGLNVRLLSKAKQDVAFAKSIEADAWLASSELAMRAANRLARELFTARRCVVLALLVALLTAPLLLVIDHEGSKGRTSVLLVSLDRAKVCTSLDLMTNRLVAFLPDEVSPIGDSTRGWRSTICR